MSNVVAWLPADGWERLLCDAIWQSTLIAGPGLLAARFLVRQPAARAWLLLLSLTACVLVPLASLAARASSWTILAQSDARLEPQAKGSPEKLATEQGLAGRKLTFNPTPANVDDHADEAAPPQTTLVDSSRPQSNSEPVATSESIVLSAIGIVWLAASPLMGVRLVLSFLATWRLLRTSAGCDDAALLSASAAAAQRIGLTNSPALLISHNVQTPTIFALGPPRLLIPSDYSKRAAGGNNIDWTAAFTHELAHSARRDGWARLWVEFILIALPLQPLIWLARRAFHTACEEACDDWAVATGTNPVDLADTLAAWMKGPNPTAPLVAIGMSSTKSRTLRLLALRDKPIARLNRAWRWLGVPTSLLLVAGLAIAQSPTGKQEGPAHPTASATTAKSESKTSDTLPSSQRPAGKDDDVSPPPYVIEPPDILTITPVQLAPKGTPRVAPLDKVRIEVFGTLRDQPISGMFQVDSSGEVVLGPGYGALKISGLTRLEAQQAVEKKLSEILAQPEAAVTIDESRRESGFSGKHPVGPDGKINLGVYGAVKVAGLTVAEARAAVEKKLSDFFLEPKVAVDVASYGSKVFYLIVGNTLRRLPTTGTEKVMDVISECQEVPLITMIKSISISRPSSGASKEQHLEVHWKEVLQGQDATNYQIFPGDRIFVQLGGTADAPPIPDKPHF